MAKPRKAKTKTRAKAKKTAKVKSKAKAASRAKAKTRAKAKKTAKVKSKAKTTPKAKAASRAKKGSKAKAGPKTRSSSRSRSSRVRSAASNGQWVAVRDKLVEQRREILDLYERDLKVGQAAADEGTDDLVDRANNSYNREFMFSLSDGERKTLLAIDQALERIDDGSYGSCLHCSEPIGKPRLEAVPWARFCIGCQEALEQGMLEEMSE